MMSGKWFFLVAGSVLLAGCATKDEPLPEPPPGKVRVEAKPRSGGEALRAADAPARSGRESASGRRDRHGELPEPPVSPNRAAMQRTISAQGGPALKPGRRGDRPAGLDGELNDVERSYVRDIRERNARTEQAAGEQVFGGFLPNRR